MANSIFRGQSCDEPSTKTGVVAGAYLPGTFVTIASDTLTQAASAEGRLLILTNRDYYTQDSSTAYASGETGAAYRFKKELEFQALAAVGNYTDGAELTVNASGQVALAASTDVVVAFVDGAKNITGAPALLDIVSSDRYVKS